MGRSAKSSVTMRLQFVMRGVAIAPYPFEKKKKTKEKKQQFV
jgi:hypothetical protein